MEYGKWDDTFVQIGNIAQFKTNLKSKSNVQWNEAEVSEKEEKRKARVNKDLQGRKLKTEWRKWTCTTALYSFSGTMSSSTLLLPSPSLLLSPFPPSSSIFSSSFFSLDSFSSSSCLLFWRSLRSSASKHVTCKGKCK